MHRPRRHAGRLLALLGASTALVSAAPAHAEEPVPEIERTVLTADPPVASIIPGLDVPLAFKGRLTRTDGAPPVASREVVAYVDGQRACSASTMADGSWYCTGTLADVLSALLAFGYEARFAGTETLAPSTARAPALRVASLSIF